MKQIYLTILSMLLAFSTFAQDTTKQEVISPELMNVKDAFIRARLVDGTYWSLYAKHNEKKYSPTKAEDVMTDVDNYLEVTPSVNKSQGRIKEFELIKKYRNNIYTTFQGLKLLGTDQLGEFFYEDSYLPTHFAMYGDTALSFIITGVFIDNVYNTLKLTARQRATKVLTTYILTSLTAFANSFHGTEIKYLGMACVYGSKDFSDDDTKEEFVGFIAPVKLINKYIAGDLTEDDLVNGADVFIGDRDMSVGVKKIKITLE
jgi:hypothetical protein